MINKRFIPFFCFLFFTFCRSFCFLLFAFCFIGLTSCSSPTATPKGTLTGTVSLEGLSNHSLISVALYNLAYLDTTIVRINSQYPHIGIIITQHTEFDHRLQSPIKYTETLADGSFEITKIPTGKYNLVAMKSDFGFKYLYEIEIEEGENEISQARCHPEFIEGRSEISSRNKDQRLKIKNLKSKSSQPFDPSSLVLLSRRSEAKTDDPENRSSDLTLFPETVISGNIQENITVLPDHHLIIDDDTVFVPNTSSLTIHPGAVIRINPGIDLTIHGNLLAQGEENNMFWITSNDGFYELTPNPSLKKEGKLKNSERNVILSSCHHFDRLSTTPEFIEGGKEGSQHNSPVHRSFSEDRKEVHPSRNFDLELYNSMQLSELASVSDDLINWGKFDYANTCLLNQVNNLHMQNGIFRDAGCGFKSTDVDSTFCSNMLGTNCFNESVISINFVKYGIYQDILSINNNYGIYTSSDEYLTIKNNYFASNNYGVFCSAFHGEIKNNEFHNNFPFDVFCGGGDINFPTTCDISNNEFYSENALQIIDLPNSNYHNFSEVNILENNFFSNECFIYYSSDVMLQPIFCSENFYNYLQSYEYIFQKIYNTNGESNIGLILEGIQLQPINNIGILQ